MKNIPQKESRYYPTFREFLTDVSDRYADAPAITTYLRGSKRHDKSFRELKEDSFAFASALFASGLNGKHVALIGENSYEWLVSYFGTAIAGGVSICIDTEHADQTILEMVQQADAEGIICSSALRNLCSTIEEEIPQIKRVIVIGGKEDDPESFTSFLLMSKDAEAQHRFSAYQIDPKQTASIVYTSGTTSTAKPVMLSHSAILSNAADSLTILDSRERIFNSLPLYHTYGLTCGVLCGLIRGINVCLSCDLKRMVQEMTQFKPNLLVAVPLIIEVIHKIIWSSIEKAGKKISVQRMIKLESLLHRPGVIIGTGIKAALKGTCLEELDVILSGGAYLAQNIAKDLLHMGIVVLQGYGITECSPSISCNRNEDFSLDSVGMILPGNEVKFIEDEILVRGYSMMSGYYKAPELTAESYDEEGWFKTGDLGYLDKKGHLHITGRKKNLIVMKNGKKVAAEEMENEIRKMPLVKEVMVYGALSGASTDDVKIAAIIYPDPALTENMSNYEILEQLQVYINEMNAKLPIYKQVQMINIRETDFERTASRKIKRQNIQENAQG
ncbi:AMP-binding protein [Massiliimalia massiliensis]|uniref:AMP-binding protein n=1 Tax=Massiliimalia massiliensis TaxID=1852384 RepID=UPI000984145B|nr:AMP-binding protein [Massiliimalia massiliensis]